MPVMMEVVSLPPAVIALSCDANGRADAPPGHSRRTESLPSGVQSIGEILPLVLAELGIEL